jgi:hypothetical protein
MKVLNPQPRSSVLRLNYNVLGCPFRRDGTNLIPERLNPSDVHRLVLDIDAKRKKNRPSQILQPNGYCLLVTQSTGDLSFDVSTNVWRHNGNVRRRAFVENNLEFGTACVGYKLFETPLSSIRRPRLLFLDR